MTVHIVLRQGGVARILESDGDRTVVISPVPSPPGSTFVGSVEGSSGELQLKVKNCRRVEEGFRIEGRLRNATRELRERVLG
jgi:hypothetical protein